MFFLNLLMAIALAQSPTNELSIEQKENSSALDKVKFEFYGELALESSYTKLGGQRQQNQPSIQNFSIATRMLFDDSLNVFIELLGEQNQEDTDVFFGEIFANYSMPFYKNINLSVGNMYYDYGLLVRQEGLLSKRPDYYTDLLVTRRGIDLGATIKWQPLSQLPLYASYSQFSGKTLRAGDQQIKRADIQPQFASLTYDPTFLKAQTTYLQRKYNDGPTFTTFGLSVEAKELPIFWHWLKLQPMAEAWNLEYRRSDGVIREGTAYMVGNKTSVFDFFHRWLYSNEDWSTQSLTSENLLSKYQLHGIGYQFNKYFHFEYQKIISTESQSSLDLLTTNDDVYRVFLVF